jgi:hypothetical protein
MTHLIFHWESIYLYLFLASVTTYFELTLRDLRAFAQKLRSHSPRTWSAKSLPPTGMHQLSNLSFVFPVYARKCR